MSRSLEVTIERFPDVDCLNYERNEHFTRNVLVHITQECDSLIDLVVNGKNLLNGYEGAFVYPTYSFLLNVNNGLVTTLDETRSIIPIYLQQYSFSEDSPQHQLLVELPSPATQVATVSFHWCKWLEQPTGLPVVEKECVSLKDFVDEVTRNIKEYKLTVSRILDELEVRFPNDMNPLFRTFADLIHAWNRYMSKT